MTASRPPCPARARRLAGPATLVALALAATACSASINDVTLPGGAASRDVFGSAPTRSYTLVFDNALDLVPQSSVHVNDVNVGDVESVQLADGKAKVRIRVLDTVAVPANVTGVLRQTSLLGEKFVSLEVPAGTAPVGRLAENAVIPADDTSQELEAEDLFGALSSLLNGGGVQQLQTISVELSKALTGRESQLRDLLSQLTTLTTKLDARRGEIVRALDSLDRLSKTLADQRQVIATALDTITPGLQVVDESRKDLVALLQGLDRLSAVAVRVQNRTRADAVADLRALEPTLARLQQAGNNIVGSLQLLVTFPFGDNALKAIFSDYTGLYATLNVDLRPGATANPLGPDGLCGNLPSNAPLDLCKAAAGGLPVPGVGPGGTSAKGGSGGGKVPVPVPTRGTARAPSNSGAPGPPSPAASPSGLDTILGGPLVGGGR